MPSARIIIVEDHIMVRQLLGSLIRDTLKLNLVAEVTTAAEATTVCLREKPDVVVLDWALPDGRGFQVLRAVSEKLPLTRWLVLSSNEQEHLVCEAIELGVQGFVFKRSDISLFREAITRVVAGKTYYCPRSAQLYVEAKRSERTTVASNLTARERQVLRAYARGENPKVTADQLGVAVKTVNNIMTAIKEKLGLKEPAELVRYAIKHGYVEAP